MKVCCDNGRLLESLTDDEKKSCNSSTCTGCINVDNSAGAKLTILKDVRGNLYISGVENLHEGDVFYKLESK